jgi:hypothetical protein
MSANAIIVEGFVRPDGTLDLTDKVPLPQGRVQLTVVPLPELPEDDPFWQMLERIWADQKARGHVPRSAAEVEAERQAVREEWEECMRRIERVQAEAEAARKARG